MVDGWIASWWQPRKTIPVTAESLSLYSCVTHEQQNEEGFRPRRDLEPWPVSFPIDWGADPFGDRNWRFHLHAWRMMDPIIVRYVEAGDVAYLQEAMSFARDWYQYHCVDFKTSEFSWYDMAAGFRAARLAYLRAQISAGKWNASTTDLHVLSNLAAEHATRLKVEKFISLGNHGLFQTVGLDMLCQEFHELPECRGGRRFAAKMFKKISLDQFTDEGIHRENSPQYHGFVLTAMERSGGADRFGLPDLRRKMDLAERAWPYMVFPNGKIVQVGDSAGLVPPSLEADSTPTKLQDGKSYAVRDWSKSGYIVIRSNPPAGDSMLFVTGMNHVRTHKHADNLSFELFEHGRFIFVDSGKYSYNRNAWRDYFQCAAAHNTVSLLEAPQNPTDVELGGSSLLPLEIKSRGFVVRGAAKFPKLGFTQEREITYEPGKRLIVRDTINSRSLRTFVSSLVLSPDLHPSIEGNMFTIDIGNGKRIAAGVEGPGCFIEAVRGRADPPLGWVSDAYLKKEPTTVVRAVCSGSREQTVTWRIDLDA